MNAMLPCSTTCLKISRGVGVVQKLPAKPEKTVFGKTWW